MKLITLGTLSIFVLAIADFGHSFILTDKKGVIRVLVGGLGEMAKEAQDELAPFPEDTISRLENTNFGLETGGRSTDTLIVNKSDYDFILNNEPKCLTSGKWAPLLSPDIQIPAHSSSAFRAQTAGVYNGPKDCETKYLTSTRDNNGPQFQVRTSNAFLEPARATGSACCGVKISKVAGGGLHNRVRFIIENSDTQE